MAPKRQFKSEQWYHSFSAVVVSASARLTPTVLSESQPSLINRPSLQRSHLRPTKLGRHMQRPVICSQSLRIDPTRWQSHTVCQLLNSYLKRVKSVECLLYIFHLRIVFSRIQLREIQIPSKAN